MKKPFPLIPTVLTLLILLCLAAGFLNYNALLNSDQYSYLTYGRGLARGGFAVDYPLLDLLRERLDDGIQRPLYYGRRFYSDGEVISTLEPGFPLLLAVAIRLGGLPAAFGVNVFLLAVFLISYFLVARGEDPVRPSVALAAVFVLFSWDSQIAIAYSLNLMRDIPAVAFLWLGLCLFFRSLPLSGRTVPVFFLGVAALAVSGLVRLTNLVILAPLVPYILVSIRKEIWGWGKIALAGVASVAVISLVFLPQILEEAYVLGDPLSFVRRALAAFSGFFNRGASTSVHTFSLLHLGNNLPRNLSSIYSVIALPGLILLAAGIFAARRRLSTWLVMIPVPLLHLLLFSAFGHRARRYRFPVYPFLAYFIALGAIRILNYWPVLRQKLPPPARVAAGLIVALAAGVFFGLRLAGGAGLDYSNIFLLALILMAVLPYISLRLRWWPLPGAVFTVGAGLILLPGLFKMIVHSDGFQWRDVVHLREELEHSLPEGALVLGQRYLIQNLDAYTYAHGISPGNLTAVLDSDLARSVMIVEDSGCPVYALDNRGFRSMASEIRELDRYFDLEPVNRWLSAELKIEQPYYSSAEELTLFRVARREQTETVLTLATSRKADYLVLIDTGQPLLPADPAEGTRVKIEGREIPVEFGDSLNYLLVAAEDVYPPETRLEVGFYRPLPSQPLRGLFPLADSFRIDFGVGIEPDDELFVRHGLYLDRRRRRTYRVMGPEAAVILPRLVPPGGEGRLELRVKNLLDGGYPVNLLVRPDSEKVSGRTIPADGEWHLMKVPLPGRSPRQGSFNLDLIAQPVVPGPEEQEALDGSAFLAIDWLEISWSEGSPESPGAE